MFHKSLDAIVPTDDFFTQASELTDPIHGIYAPWIIICGVIVLLLILVIYAVSKIRSRSNSSLPEDSNASREDKDTESC